jgi:S1-C subfamily serine protease
MKDGDVVLAIDDHYLYTGQEMNEEIFRHKPGTRITVRYRRDGPIYEASVVVGTAQ